MKIGIYTIKDAQAAVFMKPTFFQTEEIAKRTFLQAVMNPNETMGQFPADYTLYKVGQYDDESGTPQPQDPLRICNGEEILNKKKEDVQRIKNLHEQISQINEE